MVGTIGLMLSASSVLGGSVTYNFDSNPSDLKIIAAISGEGGGAGDGVSQGGWVSTGGNPATGGFLAVTYSANYMNTHIQFPNLDPGKVVTAFAFEMDLRIGNSVGARAADGFSINFARADDPVLLYWTDYPGRGYAGEYDPATSTYGSWYPKANPGGRNPENISLPETGVSRGLAISFDTWEGNGLPDANDIEGIIVRVDNKTVLRQAMPTRHGAVDNATSLQTGPRDAAYWTAGLPANEPDAWKTLGWAHLTATLDELQKLTIIWKGKTILDHYQTKFFPSPGQLIFAGRTGGSDEHTHVDNLKLTTTAVVATTTPPTVPANIKAPAETLGARRLVLTWDPSIAEGGVLVSYRLQKDGVDLPGIFIDPTYTDEEVRPNTSYTYKIKAVDVSQNASAWGTFTVKTGGEVASLGWISMDIYDGISDVNVANLLDDAKYPNSPDRGVYLSGLSFGEWTSFGETYGDNYGAQIKGTLTVPATGQWRFFIRSDDASQLFLSTSASIPVVGAVAPICEESDCCDAFVDPGTLNDDGVTSATSAPISLTAGTQYGFLVLFKEGTGGDWLQVAMRKEGDTTAPANLEPIRGAFLAGVSDSVGAVAKITQAPKDTTVLANEKVTFSVAANTASPYTTNVLYQWYKNGSPIYSANASTYEIPVAAVADSGAKFKVMVAVPGAAETSSEVTLTVNTDTKPPTMVAVAGSDTFTQATITFSEPVTAASAATAANYAFSGGVTVSSAAVVDQYTVRLTTSKQTENTDYTITVNNVKDNAGNSVTANSQIRYPSWRVVSNRVKLERYNDPDPASATDVATLMANPNYPGKPDATDYLSAFSFGEWTSFGETYGDSYGARLKAWLIPTDSGSYNFFIRSDDASELYLSTNDTFPVPGTDTPIAQETDCCDAFVDPGTLNDDGATSATSDPVSLVAGKRYAILALMKEGGGGDYCQVAWRKVGDTTSADSLNPLSDVVWYYGPPAQVLPTVPTLAVTRTATAMTLTFTGSLQSADGITGPWADVTGGSPQTVSFTGTAKFFRAVNK